MPTLAVQAKSLSGLSSGTLAQHMLAIVAGTGTGATVFVERVTLCLEASTLTLVRKPRADVQRPSVQTAARPGRKQAKRIDIFLAPKQMWLVSRKTTTSHELGKKNRVITTSDKMVGTIN